MGGQRDTFQQFFHSFFISTKFWQWGTASPYSFCLYIVCYCLNFSYLLYLCLNFTIFFFTNKIPKYQKVLLSFHYLSIIILLHLSTFQHTFFHFLSHYHFNIHFIFLHSSISSFSAFIPPSFTVNHHSFKTFTLFSLFKTFILFHLFPNQKHSFQFLFPLFLLFYF